MAEPTVRVSGIVLSSLAFQHLNTDSDVEGLVLGESRSEEQVTISDSQSDHIHIEEIYHVQKHISCQRLSHFYNGVGDVRLDAVKKILGNNKQEKVIGWYRQRRNSEQQMSFREKLVHGRLKAALSNPHILFLLLTPCRSTAAGSTHRTEYAAFISRSRHFLKVPVLVTNLGLGEQLAYWRAPPPCSAAGYSAAMNKHSSSFFSANGLLREVNDVNAMNETLQDELQAASRKLQESERRLESLQAEVSALSSMITEKRKLKGAGRAVRRKQLIEVLLCCSPLLHTHTLTLTALPVADGCCRARRPEEGDAVSTATQTPDTASDQETPRDNTTCRKRAKEEEEEEEAPPERAKRRRKSPNT